MTRSADDIHRAATPHFLDRVERDGYDHPDPGNPQRMGERDRVGWVVDAVRKRFPQPDASRIGEFGCGPAVISRLLVSAGYRVVALDVRPDFLIRARCRAGGGYWVCGDIGGGVPFAPGALDAVILADVLEHCRRPLPVLDAVLEALHPSGCLVLTARNSRRFSRLKGQRRTDAAGRFSLREALRWCPAEAFPESFGYLGRNHLLGHRFAAALRHRLGPAVLQRIQQGLARTPLINRSTCSHFYLVLRRRPHDRRCAAR